MVRGTAAHRRHGVPEVAADLSPDYVAIVVALRKIPAGQRQAIVLHHLSGLSVSEISREAGVPVGTVKARLSRGRRALAAHLGESGPETGFNGMEVPNHA
jgi:RNA polymerase sigma-70 factor (ECF subfamily)